jgi:serine/threonine protein kinase
MTDSVITHTPSLNGDSPYADERALLEAHVGSTYQVVREIGRGGMGIVFLARDITLHRHVAIKVLRRDFARVDEQRERFRREARITAQLHDDGIVAIHNFREHGDLVYMVMEYVTGVALGSRLAAVGTIDAEVARDILASLARTLDHAHSRGIVHRDLKPENILFDRETGRPRLTDFGIALARTLDPARSDVARAFGTPEFMSPEQAAGETYVDGRSDVYSLGVLGYRMLTGQLPFEGTSFAELASKHITESPRPIQSLNSDVPRDLAQAIEKCLEKAPERRWRRAGDFADAISTAKSPLTVSELVSRLGRFAALVAVAAGLAAGSN